MSYQPFLIAGFQIGLQEDLRPWLLPQDAFQSLINGHIHNSVVEKRSGMTVFQWFVNSNITTINTITQANPGVVTPASVAGLSNGDYFQIRSATGMTQINNKTYQIQNLTATTFEIYTIYGEPLDTSAFGAYIGAGVLFIVPKNPIMGIKNFIDNSGNQQIVIFDTKRMCVYNKLTQVFDPIDTSDIFNGTPSSFISAASYGKTLSFSTSTLFFTNFNGDMTLPISPMFTYDGIAPSTTQFLPNVTPTTTATYVVAAQFIFSIRNRLLLLNTVESTTAPAGSPPVTPSASSTNYSQRMRWSRSFDPTDWDQITPGKGGFTDAPTSEKIIAATQLEDTILVQFTNSVWIIEPTSDPAAPFRWVKINSYRTCTAPYANVAHDDYVISYGNRGIVASSRNEVVRIDNKIEDFMMDNVNAEFAERMYSERDFTQRRSWTLYPDANRSGDYPNEDTTSNFALIRTEEEGAWSIYKVANFDIDSENGTNLSCLGYGAFSIDKTFDDFEDEDTFDSPVSNNNWTDFLLQAETEVFLAGDQTGRILTLNSGGSDLNQPIEFELTSAGWNPFAEQGMQAQLGYVDFYVEADKNIRFNVEFYVDDITTPYATQTVDCLPNLGFIGEILDITQANPAVVNSPSHGLSTGAEVYLYGVDGMIDIEGGPYIITFVDQNHFSLNGVDSTVFQAYTGNGSVVDRQYENYRCWKRAYAGGVGYQHFIKITNSDNNDSLVFNAFKPHFRPVGQRIIGG